MKKFGLLFILQVLACCLAVGQQSAPAPARIVTSYALTSVPDLWLSRDPSAWRLLASNDGLTWDQLDVRNDQHSINQCSRKLFHISNQKAYRIYRLEIEGNVAGTPREVGLSEVELMGPVVGVDNEADLRANITSSQEQPVVGAAVNAFDGDVTTRWIDFAPFKSGGCWIQCEYVRHSEMVITNASQVRVVTLLAGAPSLLVEKSPEILYNLNASLKRPERLLVGYALTSANDSPWRDPRDWSLLGSNNRGESWETVDVRRNEIFSTRLHRRVFKLAKASSFALYRLLINVGAATDATQLAELEPLYADQQSDSNFSLMISASGENAPMEKTEMAFDHAPASKWLCFDGPTNLTAWIQWQCLPKIADLPLIDLDQFSRLLKRTDRSTPVPPPENLVRTLIAYSLVSANDVPARDPRDWRLLGSNDGKSWQILDVHQGEKFTDRFQKRTFDLTNPRPCAFYRFEFVSVLDPTNANSIQLAEIEPEYAGQTTNDQYSVVVSARADNAPVEGMENLFDGDLNTKWLDPGEDVSRSSWVQWYLAKRQKTTVIRADSKPAVQPGLPQSIKLRLDGVAVCATSNLLGFLDASGFQMFQFASPLPPVKVGNRVRLAGALRFGKEYPLVQDPDLVAEGALTNVLKDELERNFAGGLPFVMGSVEGRVLAVSEDRLYSTLRFAPETGSGLLVRIFNPQHVSLSTFASSRLRVRGLIEPVFDEKGRLSAGGIWVSGLNDVTVLAMTESSRPAPRLPETNELSSIHQILEVCKNEPGKMFNVKVRGVITYIDLGITGWYLQDGPDAIYVQKQYSAGINPYLRQEGMYVELRGTVGGDSGLQILPSDFVTFLGKGRMPEPLRHSLDYLVSGIDDGKWVQLEGVVTAGEKQRLTLRVNGGSLVVWLNESDWKESDRLLGSLVRVSGVCAPLFNPRQQRFGVRLLVPSPDWVEILEPSPEKPFDLPARSIGSLLQSSPRTLGPRTPLRKITGVVTYGEPGVVFVQTNSEALRVFPREETDVQPGDVVEAVGLPEPDGLTPKLTQALIKKTGRAPLPPANPINVQDLDSAGDDSVPDATRGWAEATVVGLSANDSVQTLELQQEETKIPFRAFLSRTAAGLFSVPIGSRVRLEGAFKAKADTVPDYGQVVTSFDMYLNSAADIIVLERPPWWTPRHTLWIFGGLGVVLLASLTWIWSLRLRVRRRTRELHAVIARHEQTEVQLQAEISERKRMEIEVQKTHQALVESSRQAGMAEVATSVLHNVGNVLNSVNVASSIVAENVHKSSGANLAKVVALLNEHTADLGAYMTSDPKGRLIPSYLAQLAALLEREKATTLGEVDSLRQNIEHIKQIVARQQTYARVAGVTEKVSVAELVEEALRTNSGALNGHNLTVVREYDPQVSKITVDKYKLLQILVNVVCNARHACNDARVKDKLMTVRVRAGDGRVSISVSDNGIGIPPENLTKIFNHGFTTRKDGHGFGLHSGALAARELGGSLTAYSEGQNRGATFTLELPLEPPGSPEPAARPAVAAHHGV